jgi:hypothetical protein
MDRPEAALTLAALACGRFLDSNFLLGQVNLFILFLITLGLYAAWRGREVGAGLAVACATAIKVTPGLFGLYFLWTGRARALFGGAAGLILFLLLIPSLTLGFSLNLRLLEAFAHHALRSIAPGAPPNPDSAKNLNGEKADPGNAEPQLGPATQIGPSSAGVIPGASKEAASGAVPNAASQAEVQDRAGARRSQDPPSRVGWRKQAAATERPAGQPVGISLKGTLGKWLTRGGAEGDEDGGRGLGWADLDPATAGRIALVLSLLLLCCTVWITYGVLGRPEAEARVLAWGLVALTMLLISPLTRKAHGVVVLIPACALAALLFRGGLEGWARRWASFALSFSALASALSSPGILGKAWAGAIHDAGLFTLIFIIFYIATAVALRQRTGQGRVSGAEPGGVGGGAEVKTPDRERV